MQKYKYNNLKHSPFLAELNVPVCTVRQYKVLIYMY